MDETRQDEFLIRRLLEHWVVARHGERTRFARV